MYTQIIKNASKQELLPIIRKLVRKQSTIYTDKWKAYDSLVLDGYKHKRINHSKTYSNRKGSQVNGIETSGVLPREDSLSLMASHEKHSSSISKNVSLGTITKVLYLNH